MTSNFFHLLTISFLLTTLFACNAQNEDPASVATNETTTNTNNTVATAERTISLDGADSAMGKRFFIQCQACHTVAAGDEVLIGPNLWGIVGRAAGKQEGFQYSPKLAEADFNWSLDSLDQYITNPNNFIAGTTMVFAGSPNEKMRRDLLAYLVEATTNP